MSKKEIEQKIRRSSFKVDPNLFRDYLEYAQVVRDEDEVYDFMEENKIGIDEPEFWMAKLRHLKNRCQFKQFIKTMNIIDRNQFLKNHPKYWLIREVENQAERQLRKFIKKKQKKRKTISEYQWLTHANFEKQTIKFEKLEVYVDHENRRNYSLESIVDFLMNDENVLDEMELNRNIYLRGESRKPLSFISQKTQKIQNLAESLIFTQRKSERKSLRQSGRLSNSNKLLQTPKTPEFKGRERNLLCEKEFSFGKDQSISLDSSPNIAFFMDGNSIQSKNSDDDVELQILLNEHEIQNPFSQPTLTQTISQFDSNKENNFLQGKQYTFRDKKFFWDEDEDIRNDFNQLFELNDNKIKQRISENVGSERSKRYSWISSEKSKSFSDDKSFRKR